MDWSNPYADDVVFAAVILVVVVCISLYLLVYSRDSHERYDG